MGQDRLTPLDASFLHVEAPATPMHVACVMIFEGDAPPYDEFVRRVERRLHLVPRYRQKLASVPFGQGRPVWVDDPDFDVRYHLRATGLPRPGTEYELEVLAGRVFSHPLNRDKPLWETWLVEGLRGGRFAVLSKTHHAAVDGISGLDVLSVLFSPDEDAQDPGQWRPRPSPSGAELLAEALWERATIPGEIVRPARFLLRRPRRVAERVFETAVGVGALAWAGLRPAPETPYNRRVVGPDRRFAWVRGSLEEVKEVRNSLGGTVNDVILTVVTRALRRHLLRRGYDIDGLAIKVFVPVSVRTDEQRGGGALGNQVSGMVASLPVGCDRPTSCLAQISEAMSGLKESGQAVGARALTELSGFAPPTILSQAARLVTRQRFVNLVVTNVPGPQHALYLGDRRLLDIFPMVPLGANMGLGVAIVSYNGTINFGLVGDFDAIPDLEVLAKDFEGAFVEVADAAGVRHRPGRGREVAPADGAREGEGAPVGEEAEGPVDRAVEGDYDRGNGAGPGRLEREAEPDQPARDQPARDQAASDEPILVAESADPGAQDGAGAQVTVDPPWPGYDDMRAADIVDRLRAADAELVSVVRLYETTHKRRRSVISASERELRS